PTPPAGGYPQATPAQPAAHPTGPFVPGGYAQPQAQPSTNPGYPAPPAPPGHPGTAMPPSPMQGSPPGGSPMHGHPSMPSAQLAATVMTNATPVPGGWEHHGEASTEASGVKPVGARTGAPSTQALSSHASHPSFPSMPLATRPPTSSDDPLVGQTIDDRYIIEGLLGEGGMGVVYSAKHAKLGRKYAVKVLRRELADDTEILTRFMTEARAASEIGNRHITDVVDFGTMPDGSTYFAMEYLDGQSLTQIIEQRPDARRIATIAMQVTNGLGAAHERGIVHRDLKPDNIFVTKHAGSDFVKILDFGIAKVTSHNDSQKLTKAGAVFGTPHYMSPEQAAGLNVDHRADIYALGVIMYEMAAGRLPFEAESFMGILTKHMYEAPAPIRTVVQGADCPPALEAIVQKCLEKRPERRYQSCGELGEDLHRFLSGEVVTALKELGSSGGRFNIPPDYFRKDATPGAAAESVRKPSRTPLYAASAFALFTVALGAYAVVPGLRAKPTAAATNAPQAPPTPVTAAAPTETAAATATATPTATLATPPVDAIEIELRSRTKNAVVVDGDTERPLPAKISVEKGKTRSLIVKAPGVAPAVVDVDGTKPVVDVPLGRIGGPSSAGAKPPPSATATATSKPNNLDGPVDIFGNDKKKK
ncbi:MAG TPA: serine/threonine-protein kinase, partial [Polyangiaceae bacterium]|nr:serine/threonine-protein kinase [Polyangiaceae bacterium]